RAERCDNLHKAVSDIPGVWGHLLSFLGGPKACIACRFSIVELFILFALGRAFEYEPAVPASQIDKKFTLLQHHILRGHSTDKAQLPLLVKPYQRRD
ncbi:hypothetical protein BDN67DRAFT_902973, partial [Paxillus ammoniavirescens]